MTFTYAGIFSTDLDKIRHSIRDVIEDEGILPGGYNFSDGEITFELTLVESWFYVVPKLLRVTSNAWASRAAMMEEGDAHMEDTRSITKHLRDQAKNWEEEVISKMTGKAGNLVSYYDDATATLPFYETGVEAV